MDCFIRGSIIGTVIGAIPGLGGTVASFIAYTSTVQASSDPSSFGKGNIIGVIAPESANNAKDGGSLVPTVAFGIPGSAETAVFLGHPWCFMALIQGQLCCWRTRGKFTA